MLSEDFTETVPLHQPCGLFLGWKNVIFAFFAAVVVGGVTAVFLLAGKKKGRKDHVPFGPSLCMGVAAAMFFGGTLVDAYLSLLKI